MLGHLKGSDVPVSVKPDRPGEVRVVAQEVEDIIYHVVTDKGGNMRNAGAHFAPPRDRTRRPIEARAI